MPFLVLLTRADRVLGVLSSGDMVASEPEQAVIQEIVPLMWNMLPRRGRDDEERMLEMQKLISKQLKKWVGRVADSVLIKMLCFAVTASTFHKISNVNPALSPYIEVQDPRLGVAEYTGRMSSFMSPRLENRNSRYWDDALDYFLDDSKDMATGTYTLADFMKYKGFTLDRLDGDLRQRYYVK